MSVDDHNERQNRLAREAWLAANPHAPKVLGGTMPNWSQMIHSKYMAKTDLIQPLYLTIRGVVLESDSRSGPGSEAKWVMYFNEHQKGLRLNNTILRYLESVLGPSSDAAVGKQCRVYVDPTVQMAGQVVGGIRVEIAPQHLVQQAPPAWGAPAAAAPVQQPPPGWNPPAASQPAQAPAGSWGQPAGAPAVWGGQAAPAARPAGPGNPDAPFDDKIPF